MKLKLLCLALVLSVLIGCSCTPIQRTHGISLSGSEMQIRASILRITPLGTPLKDVKARIQTKLRPDTFYNFPHGVPLPGTGVGNGKIVWDQWPLGEEHHGKVFGCQIGRIGSGVFIFLGDLPVDVGAYWAFDDKDRLADVFVYKTINSP